MLKKAIKMTEELFLVNIFRCIIFASIIRTKKYSLIKERTGNRD
jgi:hypothetical protein